MDSRIFLLLLSGLLAGSIFVQTQKVAFAQDIQETAENEKTVEVIIKLEGKTVKGKPRVVPAENTFAALYETAKDAKPLELEEISDDTWRCHGIEGQEYVIGWIVKKGLFAKRSKMFGYCSDPFIAQEGLTVSFSPGMPATFEYDLRKPPKGVKAVPAEVLLLIEIIKNGEKTFLSWGGSQEIKRKGILKISGLAAGKYKISARAKDVTKYLNSRTPVLYEDREVEIKTGTTNRFEPNCPEIDSTNEEGDVTIRGTLYGTDKQPLANKTVKVIPLNEHGFDLNLYYPESKTDSRGRFEFTGIRPNSMVYVSSEGVSINLNKESLTEGASVSADIVVGLKQLPVVVGQPIRDMTIDWKESAAGKFSDLKGKIVVVDVWATWCGPCIRAFPELNSLAEEFSGNKDVAFIALSIDSDRAVWERIVDESDWDALKHGWLDKKKNSYDFNQPIPYTLIIDKEGIVRAEGNGINIKNELEKLITTLD